MKMSEHVEINEEACAEIMKCYGLKSRNEAINFALRSLVLEPMTPEEIQLLREVGWEGFFDETHRSTI